MGKKSIDKKKRRAEVRQQEDEVYNTVHKAKLISNPLNDFPAFHKFERNGITATIEYSEVENLDEDTLKWILDLEKRNMEQLYNDCCWGWKEKKKVKEMTESEARYLIARTEGQPVAFAHFRFDIDYGEPVLYCYELQLEEIVRRKALGKFLLQILELIAFKNDMKKVVLTVLKHNKPAVDFFNSMKYEYDETNLVEEESELPYEILSKYNKKLLSNAP